MKSVHFFPWLSRAIFVTFTLVYQHLPGFGKTALLCRRADDERARHDSRQPRQGPRQGMGALLVLWGDARPITLPLAPDHRSSPPPEPWRHAFPRQFGPRLRRLSCLQRPRHPRRVPRPLAATPALRPWTRRASVLWGGTTRLARSPGDNLLGGQADAAIGPREKGGDL